MEPCGRKCDWIRSCYLASMVFRAGDDPVDVRWYFAKDEALWMPDGNQFVSTNWISRASKIGDLGEQPGGKPWLNGSDQKDYLGTVETCIDASWFVSGIPSGSTTGTWAAGILECCSEAVDCCDRSDLGDILLTLLPSPIDCSCMATPAEVTLTRSGPGSCVWSGSQSFCGSLLTATVTLAAGTSGPFIMDIDWPGYASETVDDGGTAECFPLGAFMGSFTVAGTNCNMSMFSILSEA